MRGVFAEFAWVGCILAALLSIAGCNDDPSSPDMPNYQPDRVVASVSNVGGNNQAVTVGSELPVVLSATLRNASGLPVDNQLAHFVVAAGGGSVSFGDVISDENGLVTARWKLGTSAGSQSVELVAANGAGTPVVLTTFTAMAMAGEAQSLTILSGDKQAGPPFQQLPLPLKVVVKDALGNPVPGVAVSFTPSDSGRASPASGVTDAMGEASTMWTFGGSPTVYPIGERTLTASSGSLSPVSFLATAYMPPFTGSGNLSFKTLAVHEVVVAWGRYDSEDRPGFKVERKIGANGTWTEIASIPFHSVSDCTFRYLCTDSYTDSNLAPATEYYYRVRAYSGPLVSGYSNEVHGTTLPGDPIHTDPYTGMVLIKVPGGTYNMGDTTGVGGQPVTVRDFYIGTFEVTQAEWLAVMGSNPSSQVACGPTCPVDRVSRLDVDQFVQRLNQLTGRTYRLATEAEWEYAARSGGLNETYSGGNDFDAVAWFEPNSGYTTHPVGQKQPNGLDLYDMSGNVSEWVSDYYFPNNPGGDGVSRGAGADGPPATTTARLRENPGSERWHLLGFRLAMSGQ